MLKEKYMYIEYKYIYGKDVRSGLHWGGIYTGAVETTLI